MLVNGYSDPSKIKTHEGTRILVETLGIIGETVIDPLEPKRWWCITDLYAPIPGRKLGGIRAKLTDEKGFITFLNQRDLEVLLGIARPGSWCRWAGEPYRKALDDEWVGLCCDEDDLRDDLLDRELLFRAAYEGPGGILFPPLEIPRLVHVEAKYDVEELYVLIHDMDPETGMCPDPRLETIDCRWARSHRMRVQWDRI